MWSKNLAIICGETTRTKDWEVHLTCYDRKVALDSKQCNDTCRSDVMALHCTNTSDPYCGTYIYEPGGILDYRCSSTRGGRQSTVSFTHDGQLDAGFSTQTFEVTKDKTSPPSTSVTTTYSHTIPASSFPSSTSTSASLPSSSDQKNLGAIIGGAVGGFVAVSLVALAVFWTIRKSRNKKSRQSFQGDSLEHEGGKTGTQIDWRSSTTTAVGWPNSVSPQIGTGQPTSPSALSETSQGIMPMRPQMTHEMSGESVQSPPHELADSRIYELGSGTADR
ncbi:hypothetical protein HYE67_000320 [Fusarium culmorum]|uniref:Uncharacterized protein n=1 Tax=Fusarium culmorum TaxID=5516 RepID=A0A7S8HRQ4_FUSCU|nr:hypothetical protein HYE67_000320 [Fusarium culmorum]